MIGGSAGSLEVLFGLLPKIRIPEHTFLLLVLHRKNSGGARLEELLREKVSVPVREIEDKDPIRPGCLYICPPDYHLLLENDCTFSLDLSERVNYNRPSIDICFSEMAHHFEKNTVGIIFSGANADGTLGCRQIRRFGGFTIAQDPNEARVPYMPQNAIDRGTIDRVMTSHEIVAYLNALE